MDERKNEKINICNEEEIVCDEQNLVLVATNILKKHKKAFEVLANG